MERSFRMITRPSPSGKFFSAVDSTSARDDMDPRCGVIHTVHSDHVPPVGISTDSHGSGSSLSCSRGAPTSIKTYPSTLDNSLDSSCSGSSLSFERGAPTSIKTYPSHSVDVLPSLVHLCSVLASSLFLSDSHRVWLRALSEGKWPPPQQDRSLTRHFNNYLYF